MKFTPEAALRFTKTSVDLLVSWPPSMNTSKKKLFILDVYFWLSFLCAQTLLVLLLNGIYAYRDNFEIMIQSICIVIAIIQMSIKMMACRMQRSSLQSIITEMESIVKLAAPHEKAVLQKYVNRSALLHIFLTFGFYLSSTNIVLGPIFLSQSLPTFAVYPFDTESHPVYEISDSVTVKFQFLVLDIVAIIQLFLNSYPAENLIEMSSTIGLAAYDLNWFDKSRKICKNLYILIQRSQKPVTVSIAGFIPELSLTYYMSFLSSSFSYFTTLRAAVN
ncbi:hypothetical protein HZH68_015615 [Vespula germanica]|uniref:Odorant receptor n=1 Tax=Vespula germanica TaxID=30212 RepID=A0A834J5A5_VESGE|nr:hypothetical protein HZH68_015615 [Vespula germanica]